MEDRILQIVLKARDEASAEIQKVGEKAGGVADILSKSFKNASIVAGVALGGLVAEGVRAIGAFTESQQVMQQTEAVLKSTGGVAGMTADSISYLAGKFQHLTGISDETIQSAENMLLTFTSIGKDVFPEATKTVLDMSVALGQDTKNSAIQLGKALNDPIQGVTALRRVGVQFNEAQQDTIKSLVESGKLLDAQKMVLKELQVEFGGSAEMAGKTFAGQVNILKNSINDLEESIGELLVNQIQPFIGGFQEVVDTIKNVAGGEEDLSSLTKTLGEQFGTFGTVVGQVIEFFGSNRVALEALAGAFGGVLSIAIISATGAMLSFIGLSLPVLLIAGAIGAVAVLIAQNWGTISVALQPVIDLFTQIFTTLKTNIEEFVNAISPAFMEIWERIKTSIGLNLTVIQNVWNAVWPSIAQTFDGVWKMIKGILQVAWGAIQLLISVGLGLITGDWSKAWGGMKVAFEDIWNGIKSFLSGTWEAIKGIFRTNINSIIGMLNGFIDIINGAGAVAGVKVGKLPSFDNGGYVPKDMLAIVHQGEFVLSKSMLAGNSPAPISTNNYSSPSVNIGSVIVNDGTDIEVLAQRLAFAFNNSGNI